jgi:hypothetical protein
MSRNHFRNGVIVSFTTEEETARDVEEQSWLDGAEVRKLAEIRKLRLNRLEQTDWMSATDITMPDNIKIWRQQLRDLPQNNTTESEYDLLLARDSDKNLIDSIWENN